MEALERERGRFRDVLELLPVSIALLTPDRRISFANRIFRERFGEAHGQRRLESAGGGNAPCESIENFRLLETMTGPNAGTYQVFEYPYRDSDGQTLMLEVRIDITEVKRAYSAVSEQAALLQLAHDAIIVTDLNGRISFWNRGAEVLYGWRPEEAVGKNMQQLLQTTVLQHRQTTPVPSMDHLKALVRDEGQWTGELAQVTRSGQTMVVASRWSLRRNDQGDPDAVLEINTDISDRKRMEEALVEQTTELARSNKELQEFAYVASHDLQEPLRMVTNFTQLLAERYAPQLGGDAREFIAFAVDGTVRMQALIQDLLAYSRVGTQGRAFAPVACNEALSRAVSNLRISIAENAALVSHEELPVVQADATQLVQLFQNLIGNGIKFKGVNTPRVHVSAVRQADAWIFATQDNGIGIEAPYAERIFEIFQRLHRREEYPGTGIGLAICKKIVERHKGKIWMESEPGHGSTFFFSIPAAGIDAGVAAGEVEVKQHG
jgi:PAS domain S-box-containing protein